jgi:hypothetical protein
VREVDLLGVLIIFEHRKVDDPAEIEAVFVDEAELFGDAGAGEAGELGGLRLLAGGEEDAVVRAEAELGDELARCLLAMVLGDRAAELAAFLRDVAEARIAFAARPFVHLVEEFAALLGRDRCRDCADDAAGLDELGEQAEAGAAEVIGDVGDQDGIAQVRLVGAVFQHRLAIGMRGKEPAGVTDLPSANSRRRRRGPARALRKHRLA